MESSPQNGEVAMNPTEIYIAGLLCGIVLGAVAVLMIYGGKR